MSCNGWKHLKNYRLNDDFCARNIEMRSASRKKTGSSHYSHQEGDVVLSCVAEIMKDVMTDELSEGVVGRWGGEEFMILLPRTSLERAADIAEKICDAVRHFDFEKHEKVTLSFGVTEYRRGERLTEFTSRVDENLYYSKEHGKDQVRAV